MQPKSIEPSVYVLWAEHTRLFKIGYTGESVAKRARAIDGMSPLAIRVVGTMSGDRSTERALHRALSQYRAHGEWFSLSEEAAWWLIELCGVDVEAVRAAAISVEDRAMLAEYRGITKTEPCQHERVRQMRKPKKSDTCGQ